MQRAIERNGIEIYTAYDDYERIVLPEPFENYIGQYGEDICDSVFREAFTEGYALLPVGEDYLHLSAVLNSYYEGIYGYARYYELIPLLKYVYKTCTVCGKIKQIREFCKHKLSRSGVEAGCKRCYVKGRDQENIRALISHRRASQMLLPSKWNKGERNSLLESWEGVCVFSKKPKPCDDHFIPLSIGHGGTYVGNMSPLSRMLNSSKSDANPFEWFEANRQRFDLEQSAFDALVVKLAQQNGLTSEEFRSFTYWCFANQRSIDEVHADNERYGYKRPSLEIWREAIGVPFPIRVDFGELSLDLAVAA